MTGREASGAIIVGVDGSGHADRAVVWASRQAALEHRPLVVLAAAHDAAWTVDAAAAVARRTEHEVTVRTQVSHQDPRGALIGASSSAHLLVLGSRGRGELGSLLLGSVSAAVSARAHCPVVVCRPAPDGVSTQGVLVGADGTHESLPVIAFAFRQASLHRVPLTVLHCYWDAVAAVADLRQPVRRAADPEALDDLDDLKALLAESVAGFAEQFPDVPVTVSLRHGLVDAALSPRGESWDLVVVGRHHDSALSRLLSGSISTTVLERSRSAVAIVPEAPRHR